MGLSQRAHHRHLRQHDAALMVWMPGKRVDAVASEDLLGAEVLDGSDRGLRGCRRSFGGALGGGDDEHHRVGSDGKRLVRMGEGLDVFAVGEPPGDFLRSNDFCCGRNPGVEISQLRSSGGRVDHPINRNIRQLDRGDQHQHWVVRRTTDIDGMGQGVNRWVW